jgi:hypothetical protein
LKTVLLQKRFDLVAKDYYEWMFTGRRRTPWTDYLMTKIPIWNGTASPAAGSLQARVMETKK